MPGFPFAFWKGTSAPPATVDLRIALDMVALTGVPNDPDETIPDTDVTDGNANDAIVYWNADNVGYSRGTAGGGIGIEGQVGSFFGLIGLCELPVVPSINSFEATAKVHLTTTAITSQQEFSIFAVECDDIAILCKVYAAQPFIGTGVIWSLFAKAEGPGGNYFTTGVQFTAGASTTLGLRVEKLGGSFNLYHVINGVDSPPVNVPYPIKAITSVLPNIYAPETGALPITLVYKEFALNCPP